MLTGSSLSHEVAAFPPERSRIIRFTFIVIFIGCLCSVSAQSSRSSILRIGYMEGGDTASLQQSDLESLAAAIQEREQLVRLMNADGIEETGFIKAESGRDMLLRLNAGELDLAFIPARLWAQQDADYEVILQLRGKGSLTRTRGQGIMHHGVVFAGPRSPWADPDTAILAADVSTWLQNNRVAAVGTQSMAGYVAPMLKLSDELQLPRPTDEIIWFDSSTEVVQAVVAGFATIGICEESAFERIRAELEDAVQLRLMYRSVPVPTDPVVVHPRFSPRRSETGRELRRAMREWFRDNRPQGLTLETAQDTGFVVVRALLTRWRALASEAN